MRKWRGLVALWAVGALVAGVGAGACTSARNALGTNASPCFQALPIAADAVHERGSFQGVRLVDASTLASYPRLRDVLTVRAGAPLGSVCAFAYQGSFTTAQVDKPLGRPATGTGRYAVVIVSTPENDLLATVVLDRIPFRFRHSV
ncbi:MAG TPA: hypothetical protein VEI83_09450 [Acidimicrobiales bacterium]|nr:hypothetical protein [Acidimicrobiales bacterium]